MILYLKPTIKLIKMIPFIIQGNYIKMGLSRSLVPEDQHVPYDSALSLQRLFNQRLHLQLFITQTNCIMACVSTLREAITKHDIELAKCNASKNCSGLHIGNRIHWHGFSAKTGIISIAQSRFLPYPKTLKTSNN